MGPALSLARRLNAIAMHHSTDRSVPAMLGDRGHLMGATVAAHVHEQEDEAEALQKHELPLIPG
jgi:hypothetical protein